MVAERDDVGAGGEDGVGHVGGEAEAVARVFAVDDGKVDAEARAQSGQACHHRVAAGPADHVAQKQDSH